MVWVVGFACCEVNALNTASNVLSTPCAYQLNYPVTFACDLLHPVQWLVICCIQQIVSLFQTLAVCGGMVNLVSSGEETP